MKYNNESEALPTPQSVFCNVLQCPMGNTLSETRIANYNSSSPTLKRPFRNTIGHLPIEPPPYRHSHPKGVNINQTPCLTIKFNWGCNIYMYIHTDLYSIVICISKYYVSQAFTYILARWRGNVSSINANIVVVFLGYTCLKKILINDTFRDRRSKVILTGLLGDIGT